MKSSAVRKDSQRVEPRRSRLPAWGGVHREEVQVDAYEGSGDGRTRRRGGQSSVMLRADTGSPCREAMAGCLGRGPREVKSTGDTARRVRQGAGHGLCFLWDLRARLLLTGQLRTEEKLGVQERGGRSQPEGRMGWAKEGAAT